MIDLLRDFSFFPLTQFIFVFWCSFHSVLGTNGWEWPSLQSWEFIFEFCMLDYSKQNIWPSQIQIEISTMRTRARLVFIELAMYILSWLKGQFWNVNFTRARRILAKMGKTSWSPHHNDIWRDETFDEFFAIPHSIISPQTLPSFTWFQTRELANRFAAAEDALHSLQVVHWFTDVLMQCTGALMFKSSDALMFWCNALMHRCTKVQMH